MTARLWWCLVAALVLSAAPLSPARADPGWRFPVDGVPYVLRGFDPPAAPWLAGHRGVDLALQAFGSVLAASDGTVTFAGPVAGQGVVVVSHGSLRSTYEPVEADVEVGEQVDAGDLLGWLEPSTDHCGRACLHWGVLKGDTYLDPLSLVDQGPPVLLPVGAPVQRSLPAASFAAHPPSAAAARWASLTAARCPVCVDST